MTRPCHRALKKSDSPSPTASLPCISRPTLSQLGLEPASFGEYGEPSQLTVCSTWILLEPGGWSPRRRTRGLFASAARPGLGPLVSGNLIENPADQSGADTE